MRSDHDNRLKCLRILHDPSHPEISPSARSPTRNVVQRPLNSIRIGRPTISTIS